MRKSYSLKFDRYLDRNSIYRHLRTKLNKNSTEAESVEIYEIKISRSNFWPMLIYLCRVSFLATLVIYKAYFKDHHIREYKENICKRWPMFYSFWKKLLRLCALRFYNQVLLDLHHWWSEELCSQHSSSSSWCVSHVLGSM